jgi:hypothetical protein
MHPECRHQMAGGARSERGLSRRDVVNLHRHLAIVRGGDGRNERPLPTVSDSLRAGLRAEMKSIRILKPLWSARRLPEHETNRENHKEYSDGSDLERECDHRGFAHAGACGVQAWRLSIRSLCNSAVTIVQESLLWFRASPRCQTFAFIQLRSLCQFLAPCSLSDSIRRAALLVDPGHPNIQLSGGFDHDVREIMSFQRDDHVHQTELPAGYRRPAPLRVNREDLSSQLLNGLIDLR